jgi:uncharacterized membrane protein
LNILLQPDRYLEEADLMSNSSPSGVRSSPKNQTVADRVRRLLVPARPPPPVNPALVRHAEKRAENAQNRVADRITAFSGSMLFVYVHLVWFGCWIGFGVEKYPFGLLTMIVSLEAIFLSTFVLISQNRADAKRQVLANQEWKTVQEEDGQNRELLDLARQILALTKQVGPSAKAFGDENKRDDELLDVSRQTLALTQEVHALAGAASKGSGK